MKINWIESNLPYDGNYFDCMETEPEMPDLSEREKEVFGITWKEANDTMFEPSFNGTELVNEELLDKWNEWEDKYNEWEKQQPEIIEWQKKKDQHNKEFDSRSFQGRGLNKPGTLIELEDGTIHLIGTINKHRGVCDDCTAFDIKTVVKRYAVLFDLEKIE